MRVRMRAGSRVRVRINNTPCPSVPRRCPANSKGQKPIQLRRGASVKHLSQPIVIKFIEPHTHTHTRTTGNRTPKTD